MADFLKNILGGSKPADPAASADSGTFLSLATSDFGSLKWCNACSVGSFIANCEMRCGDAQSGAHTNDIDVDVDAFALGFLLLGNHARLNPYIWNYRVV